MTGCTTVKGQGNNDQNFKVKISYITLPQPVQKDFTIDNDSLIVQKSHYDNSKGKFVTISKASFNKFNKAKLISFLKKTEWETIPQILINPAILDGYHYTVNIEIENNSYTFKVRNTYHPTFDSLFTICNALIPTEKDRKKYNLPDFSK